MFVCGKNFIVEIFSDTMNMISVNLHDGSTQFFSFKYELFSCFASGGVFSGEHLLNMNNTFSMPSFNKIVWWEKKSALAVLLSLYHLAREK